MRYGEVSIDWKRGSIAPTVKKGSKEGLRNYRPDSLTSVPDKIMEKIFLESMGVVKEVNSDCQHGFTRDLIRLDRWACVSLIKFNKAKCKVLQLGQGNPKHKFRLVREWIENTLRRT